MKYLLADTFVNDETITKLPEGAVILTETEWENRKNTPYQPTFSEVVAAKIKLLSVACKTEILAGFVSFALGIVFKYEGDLESQLNLAGAKDYAVANNVSVNFTCTNQATGVKATVAHTPAQIQQVLNDGAMFKMARLSKFRTLKAQVEDPATDTVAKVEAVNWL